MYKFLCYLGIERKELIGKSSFCQDSWDWRAISPGRWRPLPCCSAVPRCTVEMGLREAGGHVKLGMGHSWVHPHTVHNHVWTAPIGSPGSRDKVVLSILHMYALPFLQPVFWKKVWFYTDLFALCLKLFFPWLILMWKEEWKECVWQRTFDVYLWWFGCLLEDPAMDLKANLRLSLDFWCRLFGSMW